ncbi:MULTISPECIES: TetR/AcrR family transcriptional regulator [Janibacter]|uniref:TetR/AcrR family transcriptional regulator n=1 Tax=Janibacter indicus TaxID=857417 RepID=A0A1W2DCP6_9MICO|nr:MULTISPECIES: TetR/AcrR family transcriptional regulator [Janibacter]QNF94160.1 TetR/AcrR family transcriptional regulator [Janibacter sp. YB324]QOK22772.1 TetR/AcrR family transcriptional regulator [Janibacter indicus]SMC95297.1 transcriptional regulator, TetR family [Janibacter indicus]
MPTKKAQTTRGTRRAPATGSRVANQRADAQRNRAKILAATVIAIRKNPDASVADIAAEAGVGRMTLYGHFQTRAELIEAALVDSLERAEEVLSEIPLDGDAGEAFQRLVASSWMFVDQSRALLATAQKELSAARIRELHEKAEARMRGLLLRGQREGAFRVDLPVTWLLTTTHVVLNGAAEEVRIGRLDPDDAPWFIDAILLPAFTATETGER